jgi:hypothetical protein
MLAGGAAFGGATPASANVCPNVGVDTNCGIIITLNSNGTATIAATGQGPYDSIEDTLVGVVNNSGSTITSIHLTSKTDIFGFDGDGASSAGFLNLKGAPNSYSGTISTNGSFNLAGPFDNFSGITGAQKSGNVIFGTGIINGGTAWFSLEEALTAASFTVKTGVPEPATLSVLGAALAGFGLLRRRRKAA